MYFEDLRLSALEKNYLGIQWYFTGGSTITKVDYFKVQWRTTNQEKKTMIVEGDKDSVMIGNLIPCSTYYVNVIARLNNSFINSDTEHIQAGIASKSWI